MRALALVHLVRRKNGIAPFERFLASYRGCPAGIAHELILLFKGFSGDHATSAYDALLEGVPHRRIFLSDRGFDINAYFMTVRRFDYEHFCFLNSFSRILDEGWLEKLYRWSRMGGVGLVGATGSAQSIAGGYTTQQQRLRSMPPLSRTKTRIAMALADRRPGALMRRVMLSVLRVAGAWRPGSDFPPFPNYHLRTNAFIGAREVLAGVKVGSLHLKVSAYRFESGNDSLTNQVLRRGLKVLVVGRDGEGYEPERWHLSNTFWQSVQENLLVADNQTEAYINADSTGRLEYSQYAWGPLARPA